MRVWLLFCSVWWIGWGVIGSYFVLVIRFVIVFVIIRNIVVVISRVSFRVRLSICVCGIGGVGVWVSRGKFVWIIWDVVIFLEIWDFIWFVSCVGGGIRNSIWVIFISFIVICIVVGDGFGIVVVICYSVWSWEFFSWVRSVRIGFVVECFVSIWCVVVFVLFWLWVDIILCVDIGVVKRNVVFGVVVVGLSIGGGWEFVSWVRIVLSLINLVLEFFFL